MSSAAEEHLGEHRERLRRFCLGYLECAEAAEDATQEALRRLLAARAAGDAPRDVRAWLFRAARNHCLNELRTRRRRRDREPLPSGFDAAAAWTGPLTKLVNAEREQDVARRLAALTDDERELLRLRYWDELSRGEIAALLELPEATV